MMYRYYCKQLVFCSASEICHEDWSEAVRPTLQEKIEFLGYFGVCQNLGVWTNIRIHMAVSINGSSPQIIHFRSCQQDLPLYNIHLGVPPFMDPPSYHVFDIPKICEHIVHTFLWIKVARVKQHLAKSESIPVWYSMVNDCMKPANIMKHMGLEWFRTQLLIKHNHVFCMVSQVPCVCLQLLCFILISCHPPDVNQNQRCQRKVWERNPRVGNPALGG